MPEILEDAVNVTTRTNDRLLQVPGEDWAQAGVDHWDRREQRSQSACDKEPQVIEVHATDNGVFLW